MAPMTTAVDRRNMVELLELRVRKRIESLSYLPTTVGVAMKFVELGKNPDAEPADYARVISSDGALSAKLLALVNSSWFAVRKNVTKIPAAVNLLGLGTVRTLAISYCMAGLHNELHLTREEAKLFWETSLCKAVAAKQLAKIIDPSHVDEAFIAGLFQDLALAVMFSVEREGLLSILQDAENDCQTQLTKERAMFRLDHAEVGRILAQKLQLPEVFVDVVAFHHNYDTLTDMIDQRTMADAAYAASLFPHVLQSWNRQNVNELRRFLEERDGGTPIRLDEFLKTVQGEFDAMYRFFEEGSVSETRLADLVAETSKEIADATTRLVGNVNDLMQQAAGNGAFVHKLSVQHEDLQDTAMRDPLTRVFNRAGFDQHAADLVAKAARYGSPIGLIYVDLDKFKPINDEFGHEFGDLALKRAADVMSDSTRHTDAVGRLGGDEFAVALYDCAYDVCQRIAGTIVAGVAAEPIKKGKRSANVSVSAGLFWFRPTKSADRLSEALSAADALMYQAKRAGGNRLCHCEGTAESTTPSKT